MESVNEILYKRTVVNILKPLKKKWKLKSFSLVIERIYHEWGLFVQTYPELAAKLKEAAKQIDETK